MAEEIQEEDGELPAEIHSNVVMLAEFLDPHLSSLSKAETPESPDRWSWRRAGIFIIAVSLMLWGMIFLIVRYAYGLR